MPLTRSKYCTLDMAEVCISPPRIVGSRLPEYMVLSRKTCQTDFLIYRFTAFKTKTFLSSATRFAKELSFFEGSQPSSDRPSGNSNMSIKMTILKGENQSTLRKTCNIATLSTTNHTRTNQGSNAGFQTQSIPRSKQARPDYRS